MSVFLLIAYFFITMRTELKWTKIGAKFIIILYILLVVFLSVYAFARQPALNSFDSLKKRMTVDSRSGQYLIFFSQVSLSDLMLGRGPNATYVFGDSEKYQFFDNAYIWMAFIGGLPIMVSYFVLIILPGIKAYFRGARGDDAAASVLIILWGLACTGLSTYSLPSVTPYCFLLYLLAGRCLKFLAETASPDLLMDRQLPN
jgi:hypothetical protein